MSNCFNGTLSLVLGANEVLIGSKTNLKEFHMETDTEAHDTEKIFSIIHLICTIFFMFLNMHLIYNLLLMHKLYLQLYFMQLF